MFDFHLNNLAPDTDACEIVVFDGKESMEITVSRDEYGTVHINIVDNTGDNVDLVLGQEGETHKL